MAAVPVEYAELQLVWPPALFAAEATALLEAGHDDETTLGWLLAEAFADDRAAQLFDELDRGNRRPVHLHSGFDGEVVGTMYKKIDAQAFPELELVRKLVHDAETLPRYAPRRYYSQRRRPQQPAAPLTLAELKTAFAAVVHRLDANGYFEGAFGSSCTDNADDPDRDGQQWLAEAVAARRSCGRWVDWESQPVSNRAGTTSSSSTSSRHSTT